jgi:histidinol-phosphate/aromatic aminotransferase/cobyric acid decarboxylase-like protein
MRRGILIRNFNAPGNLRGFMRVTVGTREENREFVDALREIIAK